MKAHKLEIDSGSGFHDGSGSGYGAGNGSGSGNESGGGFGENFGFRDGDGSGAGYGSRDDIKRKEIESNILKNIPDIDLPLYIGIWEYEENENEFLKRISEIKLCQK